MSPSDRFRRLSFVVSLPVVLAANALLPATEARAQSPAPTPPAGAPTRRADGLDTVFLKNQGLLRGTLIELLPGDHVTILLPDGSTARVAWADVDRVEQIREAAPATKPSDVVLVPTTPRPLPPSTMPSSGPTVLVHIESPKPVSLDRQDPDSEQWVTACDAPCDVALPLNNHYRIVGAGIHASSSFDLDGAPGQRVTVVVRPGSRPAMIVGGVTAGIGVVALTPGIYLSVIGAALSKTDDGKAVLTAGLVTVAASLALGIIGGYVAWTNWKTGVTQE